MLYSTVRKRSHCENDEIFQPSVRPPVRPSFHLWWYHRTTNISNEKRREGRPALSVRRKITCNKEELLSLSLVELSLASLSVYEQGVRCGWGSSFLDPSSLSPPLHHHFLLVCSASPSPLLRSELASSSSLPSSGTLLSLSRKGVCRCAVVWTYATAHSHQRRQIFPGNCLSRIFHKKKRKKEQQQHKKYRKRRLI